MDLYTSQQKINDTDLRKTHYKKKSKSKTKKQLSPQQIREVVVKKYQRQLKQFLSQHKNDRKSKIIQPAKCQIFLNWAQPQAQKSQRTQFTAKSRSKTVPDSLPRILRKNPNINRQKKSNIRQESSGNKLRRSEQLIVTRYKKIDEKLKASGKRLQTIQKKVIKQCIEVEQKNKKTINIGQNAKFNTLLPTKNVVKLDKLRVKNTQQIIANSKISKSQKKTLFYQMLLNQKQLLNQRNNLQKIENQHQILPSIPSKQNVLHFIKNYKPLDPKFNLLQLAQQKDKFIIIPTKQSIYIGLSQIQDHKKIKSGQGIYLTNKFLFQGQFQNDQKIYGIQQTQSGIYKGHFQNNLRQGKGQFRWKNDQYYNGQWKNNKKHGSGIWTSNTSNGLSPDTYIGQWSQGKVEGYGIHIFNNGKSKYEGEFKNFLKDGRGIEKLANGDKYEGHFKLGKAEGYGQYYWADGSKYKGNFKNGMRQGKGIWQQINGLRYQGNLQKDAKNGYGKIMYGNEEIFEGNFVNNLRQGQGKIKDGDVWRKGIWKQDVLVQKNQQR